MTTQAEIAGGRLSLPTELPSKGLRLNDFELTSTARKKVSLSDYRGHANLVIVAADDDQRTGAFVSSLAKQYSTIKGLEAAVLVIVRKPREAAAWHARRLKLPFVTLIDGDGRVHRDLGATAADGRTQAAIFITDRFGEVFGVYRLRDGAELPSITEIVDWLEFINSQCPECGVPEWPE